MAYAWRHYRLELIVELVLPTALAGLVLVLAAVGIPHLNDWRQQQLESNALANLFGGVLPAVGALVGGFWIIHSRTRRFFGPVSDRLLTYIRRPSYREQMGYQHRVSDDLDFVAKRLRRAYPKARVIVFIDDLDRCPDDKVMEVLQAINLILGRSQFYVVLGIDTAMIYRAIKAHYRGDGPPLPPRFAETYLQKIVQLPFHLPEIRPEERAGFIAELFSQAARQAMDGGADASATAQENVSETLDWDRDVLREPNVRTQSGGSSSARAGPTSWTTSSRRRATIRRSRTASQRP